MTKNTYGTGSFVLMNVGADVPRAGRGPAHHGRRGRSPTASRVDLRARGRDLRHRRRGAVAARRPRHHRRRGRGRAAGRVGRRHRRRRTSCPRSPASAARGGTPTPAARSSASPAAPAAPTSPARCVEAMAFQTRDVVEAMARGVGPPVARAAGRRRRVGHGPAAAAPGRPAAGAGRRARRCRRPPRSAPPTSPGWPRACGVARRDRGQLGARRRGRPSSADRAAADARYAALAPRPSSARWRLGARRRHRAADRRSLTARPGASCGALETCQLAKPGVDDPGQRRHLAPLPGPERRRRSRPSTSAIPAAGSGAQTTSSGPLGRRRRRGPSSGCRRRRPASHATSGASPWRATTRAAASSSTTDAPTRRRPCATACAHSASMASSASTRRPGPPPSRARRAGIVERLGRRPDLLDVDAVDLLHLVDQQGRRASRRAARPPARRWPDRRPARGCRCRRRRRRPRRCGWPPRRARPGRSGSQTPDDEGLHGRATGTAAPHVNADRFAPVDGPANVRDRGFLTARSSRSVPCAA